MSMKKLYLLSLLSLFLGCGEGDNSSSSDSLFENNQTIIDNNSDIAPPIDDDPIVKINKEGKAQLGVLSKATVKIYELTKENRKLLATELTTEGESIADIGNFNLHLEKLFDNKLYLYEVSGGEDYDVEDDGVINEVPTNNQGTFHLLALGSHLKSLEKVNVTIISEIIYQKLLSSLSLTEGEIITKMESISKEIIKEDINGDGFIGIEDILKYNPVLDSKKLQISYQGKIPNMINDVLNNRDSDLLAPIFKNKTSDITINENLTFIEKIEIEDESEITIQLLGDDANFFNYNSKTQELSFKTSMDFEIPRDKNKDNIFELTIEVTDSYLNQSRQNFHIEILDINETILEVPILEDSYLSIYENNVTNTFIGSITIKSKGTGEIEHFNLQGEDAQYFKVNTQGELFSNQIFDFETKANYKFEAEAVNKIGASQTVNITIQVEDVPDIKPIVKDVTLDIFENSAIGTLVGKVYMLRQGDSKILSFTLSGVNQSSFEINTDGNILLKNYLNYESYNLYYLQYSAINQAGESNRANLTIQVKNIYENTGSNYPSNEDELQSALDNGDYDFVLTQLLSNRDAYPDMDDDTVNMNIAGAYVGNSGYTIYDITGAMSDGNSSSFNDFVNNITKENDAVSTINQLEQADIYYSYIVQGLDCNNISTLTQVQKDSCYNLGLVRLTSLTNSVKLLFGGDSTTVQKWAEGVDVNSSDDLNGNGVLDASDASACAIVYANNPNDNCKDGTIYAYRGGIQFNNQGTENNLTLIEVDVGSSVYGYQNFYKLISSEVNNNTPILTSGVCDRNFNMTTQPADGLTYFPCPARNSSGEIMGIKEQIERVANIQALFPDGDETKTTVENYLTNITGSSSGTIGLDNLSIYLRTH